jgi:hypothetical protein
LIGFADCPARIVRALTPRVSFTAASQANVSENVGEVVITAEIEEAQASDVRVPLIRTGTIEPNDFSVPELVLRISAGERVGQITVKVVDDDRDELDDTLTFSMGKPIGASLGAVTTHSVTIVDNDVPPQVWFTRNPFPSPTIDEGATAWVFAKLSQPSDFEVTVPLQVSGPVNASDYAWTSPGGSQITIAPGRSSNDTNPALLRIEDDGDIERLESITLTMSAPTNAELAANSSFLPTSVSGLISVSDMPEAYVWVYPAWEKDYREDVGELRMEVHLTLASPQVLRVPFQIVSDPDFVRGPGADYELLGAGEDFIEFPAGETSANVVLRVNNDTTAESTESFGLILRDSPAVAVTGFRTHSVTTKIRDDDSVEITLQPASSTVWEDHGTVPVTLALSTPATFSYSLILRDFYGKDSYELRLNGDRLERKYESGLRSRHYFIVPVTSGATSLTLNIDIIDDTWKERNDFIELDVNRSSGAPPGAYSPGNTIQINILDDDPDVAFITPDVSIDEAAGTVTLQVGLWGIDNYGQPVSVTTNKPVTVEYARLVDTPPPTAQRNDDYYLCWDAQPSSQSCGDGGAPRITIPPNTRSIPLTVKLNPDVKREPNERFELYLQKITYAHDLLFYDAASRKRLITIIDDDYPRVSLAASPSAVTEGAGFDVIVSLDREPFQGEEVRVELRSSALSAKQGGTLPGKNDFVFMNTPLVFTFGGGLSRTVHVETLDDTVYERPEEIGFRLDGLTDNAQYATRSLNVQLADNEKLPEDATSAGSLIIDTPIPLIVEVYDDGIGNPNAPQIPGFGGGAGGGSGASIPVNPKTEPPAPPPTGGAGSSLVIVLDGYISHGITFFDANRNGQYDFLDLNGNGWRDEDEPQDRAYLTAPDGGFVFSIPEVFDRNGDGVIDWTEGQLVSVGGVDTTTQLPSRVTMRAPMGFYVVSPLTTVIADLINEHGFTLDEAVARARVGLALPDSQFARSSFIYEASQGDADAGLLFATSVKLHNTVVQWTSLFSNVPGAPPEAFVANRLYAQIAGWMATSATAIDLSDAVVQQLLALSVVTTLGIEVDPEVIRTAAEIVVAGSAKIDDAGGSGNLVEEIAQVQVVAQGNVSEQFAAVATGVTDIQTVHAEYTGPNLDASVTAAETGNVVPVLLRIGDVRITELNDGTAVADFTVSSSGPSKLPITVEYTTFDLDASAAEGDYSPSAGTLSWDAGDASSRAVRVLVHGDAICEGDETFGVFLFNSTNAAIRRREAVGTILNDDRFSYSAPNDAQANRLELYVSGDNLQLLRNEEVILAGVFSEPLSIEIEGAAEVANTLEILVEPGVVAPPHVVTFSGPGTNDQVRLLDADAPHSVHSRLSSTDGTYEIGGLEVHFTGIEQLSHELIPVVQGLDGQFLQGSPVSLSAVVAPGWQVAELHWEIISGGSLVASGQGESFTFTPARSGLFTARVSALQADYGTGILVADMRVSPTVDEDMVLVVSAPGVLEGYAAAAGQTLTVELITPPSHGDLALNPATGAFSYQAFENYYGTDAFTYRAYNGSSYSDPATVTITVTEVPDYQNPDLCEDVDHSGVVTSLDVLLGINRINAFGSELPPDPLRPATPTFYYDVNGNNSLGPLDVLITINYLNRGGTPAQGVGEGGDVGIQPFAATGATQALPNLEPAGTGADARQLIRSTPANSDLASRRRTVPERPGANRLPPARSRRHDTALAAFQQQTADPYSIALDDVLSLLAAEVAQAAV